MKKMTMLSAIISLSLSTSIFAASPVPGYSDHFQITNATISTFSMQGNVKVSQIDASNFSVTDADHTVFSGGDVFITVTNKNGSCNLDIQDSAYDRNPTVKNVNCHAAMKYMGLEHSFGSYTYILKFE